MSIDFVVTWVDGSDENWRKEKSKYGREYSCDDRELRYNDWELLKYWFRGVEKYAPWVRKIHLVTNGQVPQWLNLNNPKINVVKHEDYIDARFLPTFNSTVIENHLHRIKDLSELFVYFNDDLFLLQNMLEEDFFKDGMPCDMAAFQPVIANPYNPVMSHHFLNVSLILAKYFDKRTVVRKNIKGFFKIGYPIKYFAYNFFELLFPQFTGMYTVHGPAPFLKSTFEEVWKKEDEILEEASKNRVRCSSDVNQYLFREWQKLTGNFYPKNVHKYLGYFQISDENEELCKSIRKRNKKVICINDCIPVQDVDRVKRELIEAFETIFPNKSGFEL